MRIYRENSDSHCDTVALNGPAWQNRESLETRGRALTAAVYFDMFKNKEGRCILVN